MFCATYRNLKEELLHVIPLPFNKVVHELHVQLLTTKLGEISQ